VEGVGQEIQTAFRNSGRKKEGSLKVLGSGEVDLKRKGLEGNRRESKKKEGLAHSSKTQKGGGRNLGKR